MLNAAYLGVICTRSRSKVEEMFSKHCPAFCDSAEQGEEVVVPMKESESRISSAVRIPGVGVLPCSEPNGGALLLWRGSENRVRSAENA